MSTQLDFVDYVCDQAKNAGIITYRKMFGEYGIYCNGVIIALICDNQLFIKKTKAGLTFYPDCVLAPPYHNASLYLLIENLENSDFLCELIERSYNELNAKKK